MSKIEPETGNREQTDSDQREGGSGIMGERRGRVKLRNIYIEDPGQERVREGLNMGRQGRGEQWGEMGTTVIE